MEVDAKAKKIYSNQIKVEMTLTFDKEVSINQVIASDEKGYFMVRGEKPFEIFDMNLNKVGIINFMGSGFNLNLKSNGTLFLTVLANNK